MQPDLPSTADMERIITLALNEDIGAGDITSHALIPAAARGRACCRARQALVVCGLPVAERVFHHLDDSLQVTLRLPERAQAETGQTLLEVEGTVRSILTAERVMLNLLQRMCSVATQTHRFVQAVHDLPVTLLDTQSLRCIAEGMG